MHDAARRALSQYCSLFSGVADGLDLKYYPRRSTDSAGGVIVSPVGEDNPRLSIMEVTPASGVTSDGSSDPSFRLLRALCAMAQTATGFVVVSISVRVSSSSRNALGWCRGHLWLRCRGRRPLRLHLLLRRGGGVLLLLVLLLLLASALLLLVQAMMQSL